MTIAANVAVPLVVSGTKPRDARKRARDLLDKFGLGPLADNYPSTLSGGELQRASIARALVMEPSIVFCDEPTGALDEQQLRARGRRAAKGSRRVWRRRLDSHPRSLRVGHVRPRAPAERGETGGGVCVMMLFFRFIWPKSWRSFSVWIPLIAVGLIYVRRPLTCDGVPLRLACSARDRNAARRSWPRLFT